MDGVMRLFEGGTAGTVLVMDKGRILGSVNEKDYVCNLTHGSFPPKDVRISQIMFKDIQAATQRTPLLV